MLCRYRGCGIRGVLRGKRRLPTLRKPRRTPSEGRERSSAFPREVCAFDLLCFFAHGGFQFPRDISRPDKRRRPNEQLSRTARTRARRFAARAIGRLRRPLLLPPAAFAGRAPLQTKKLPQPVLQQPFSVREALNKSRHASCLHIFRRFARKLLEIHQVFLRHFHAILGAASA